MAAVQAWDAAGGERWRSRKTLVGLGLGQLVSILVTATGFASSELSRRVVKAYEYTSLTSVMLLDCWAIPAVIFLTWVFLKTKYRLRKYSSVAICVIGLVLVVFSDVHAGDRAGGTSPVKGDMLVIAGATLYAISNVTEEFLVKSSDQIELMGMMGLFGILISVCQMYPHLIQNSHFYWLLSEFSLRMFSIRIMPVSTTHDESMKLQDQDP